MESRIVYQYGNAAEIKVETKVSMILLDDDLSFFKRVERRVLVADDGQVRHPKLDEEILTGGFIDDENRKLMMAGEPFHTKMRAFFVAQPELLDLIVKLPLPLVWSLPEYGARLFTVEKMFDAFQNGATLDQVVRVDSGHHLVMDRNEVPIRQAMMFSYHGNQGGITDLRYNLPKLAEILMARDDVAVWAHGGGWKNDEPQYTYMGEGSTVITGAVIAKTVEEAIASIPYYNVDCGQNTVSFVWSPSPEDYRLVWEQAKKISRAGPHTERYRALIDLDLLGIREAFL